MMTGFLKVEGIEGESKDATHRRWIDVSNVSWGMSQEAVPAVDGGLAPGAAEVQALSFTHRYDRASVRLFEACATGRMIGSMIFEAVVPFREDELYVYLRAEFQDCLVTSVQTSSVGEHVMETVEVVFRSVQVESFDKPL